MTGCMRVGGVHDFFFLDVLGVFCVSWFFFLIFNFSFTSSSIVSRECRYLMSLCLGLYICSHACAYGIMWQVRQC